MRFHSACDLGELGRAVLKFLALVGNARWRKRVDQLDEEQRASPYRWRIVLDYHWLEMDLAHQAEILMRRGDLDPVQVDSHALVCLRFASAIVSIHEQLSGKGKGVLEGRLRDALKAETGFAALFLEVDLARRLMAMGYDVQWPDMEGTGQFDLLFEKGAFVAEIECKSLSADAGRQIHRKDFYRLVEYISPALDAHLQGTQQFVVSVTLRNRLSPNLGEQEELRRLVLESLALDAARTTLQTTRLRIERTPLAEALGLARPVTEDDLHAACKRIFGPSVHVAGKLSEHGGCLIVMRSEREDDSSKPLLEAMRKAATQFTGTRPAFVAVQLNELRPQELLLPHVQRRAAILSHALFSHYSQAHVNAAIFSGFNAGVLPGERFGQAGFAVMNSMPGLAVDPHVLHDVLSAVAAEQSLELSGLSGGEG
jgi:hypothetical protein